MASRPQASRAPPAPAPPAKYTEAAVATSSRRLTPQERQADRRGAGRGPSSQAKCGGGQLRDAGAGTTGPGREEVTRTVWPPELLGEVLEILARLEADRPSGGNAHFLAGPRVAPDAPLARLHLEHAEAPQLDPLALHHRALHRVEHRLDRHLGLHLGDVGGLGDLVDDVHLDHVRWTSS